MMKKRNIVAIGCLILGGNIHAWRVFLFGEDDAQPLYAASIRGDLPYVPGGPRPTKLVVDMRRKTVEEDIKKTAKVYATVNDLCYRLSNSAYKPVSEQARKVSGLA